jgi:hypothetical protein
VPAGGEPNGEIDIEPEVLAINPCDETTVEPDISKTVESLAAKPPETVIADWLGQFQSSAIRAVPGIAAAAVLEGVVAIPTVGEVDSLAASAAPRQPASTDPPAGKFPTSTEVKALAEGCLDHR